MDTPFSVHENIKSRTGMYMGLGRGTIHAGSMKQKGNTSRSIHAEVVGVSNALPKITWHRYFMDAQGYLV